MDLFYTFAGFMVGVIVGVTGVGGGSLMTPVLVLIFGISPHVAVGTDLLYAAITKTGGTIVHSLKGSIQWPIVLRLGLGSIPAAIITLLLIKQVPKSELASINHFISVTLGAALFLTAIAIIYRKVLTAWAQKNNNLTITQRNWLTTVVGAIIGTLVSISSVGAGVVGVTALILLYPKLEMRKIVGSDIAHAVPLTAVAGAGHWLLGSVDWTLLGALVLGSLPGVWIGSLISNKIPERVLRPVLATLLIIIGVKLITH